jgi:hypothetical protein
MTKTRIEIKPVDAIEPADTSSPDPFDLTKLRLNQAFAETAGVKKVINRVPVGKPNPQDWVRVHPGQSYRDTFAVIEWKEDREYYIVHPGMAAALTGEFFTATLYTCINRQGVVRLVPVRLPGPDGKVNQWHQSLKDAMEAAMLEWLRVKSNMSLGAYEIFGIEDKENKPPPPDPVWPDLTFQDLLRIAFRDRVVDRMDHPLVNRLRGRGLA